MNSLYAYSLIPVVSVASLLFFTMLVRGGRPTGLTAYCGSVAIWAGLLLLTYVDGAAHVASRASAFGVFVAASFVHTAFDFTNARSYALVWTAYAVAAVIFGAGLMIPGLLFDPTNLARGPFFWPGMLMAVGAATLPLWQLAKTYQAAEKPERRRQLRALAVAGCMGYVGAWSNALMLSHGVALPWGMLLVLASLIVLSVVVRSTQGRAERRLMERNLMYAAVTAFVSAGFVFGVLTLVEESAAGLLNQYRVSALFILFMAALAVEPIRQHVQEFIGRRIAPNTANASELARELAEQEQKSYHAQRLAELGVFTSAIAHEVRNPLGVLRAHLRILERQNVAPQTLEAMEEQIDRASSFLDDLLDYGRPRSLELRPLNLRDVVSLAFSTAAHPIDQERGFENEIEDDLIVEGDQSQITQVLVIIFENAILAIDDDHQIVARASQPAGDRHAFELVVEDDGPGVPEELRETLFEPFVTGRKRSDTNKGTGLGLAIARGIIERHNGTIRYEDGDPGARFIIELPRVTNVLAAATESKYE